ncbi:MAG: Ppx/GppA family phosphatase, partial [Polyangiales bacterium]
FDVGSVRMTERWVRSDPPIESELAAIRAALRDAFTAAPCAASLVEGLEAVVAIAGTATTYAAIDLELADYASAPPHGHRLRLDRLDELAARLAAMTLERRRTVVGLEPARADVIVAGGLTLRAAAERFGAADLVVSDRGVRWGLAIELLASA